MEIHDSSMASPSLSSSSNSEPTFSHSRLQTPSPSSSSSSSSNCCKTPEFPNPLIRQWRLYAQRNLRNQWSKLASFRQEWRSLSSSGRSHATSFVNSYLSYKYMDAMDLGVLSDMPKIREKACCKLLKQQVAVVIGMVNSSRSMRCFLKASSGSPLIQFSSSSEDSNDTGDGGGIPVFTFWSISAFETLAEELVEMFKLELVLKRLLVVELLSISCQKIKNKMSWADELYHGEADDLSICNLYSRESAEPLRPKINGWTSKTSFVESDKQPSQDVLQVYLTTWLAEVNIDTSRVEEILAAVGEEIHTSFS